MSETVDWCRSVVEQAVYIKCLIAQSSKRRVWKTQEDGLVDSVTLGNRRGFDSDNLWIMHVYI